MRFALTQAALSLRDVLLVAHGRGSASRAPAIDDGRQRLPWGHGR
ncbi:hypothetical protein ABXI76_21670 [Streptomyces parvus]